MNSTKERVIHMQNAYKPDWDQLQTHHPAAPSGLGLAPCSPYWKELIFLGRESLSLASNVKWHKIIFKYFPRALLAAEEIDPVPAKSRTV